MKGSHGLVGVNHPPQLGEVRAETKFPTKDPGWDNNHVVHKGHMMDLGNLLIQGIRDAVLQTQNISKAFEVQQGKEEGPTELLERLNSDEKIWWNRFH